MAYEVQMPKWGLTMKTGKIARWLVAEGGAVAVGQPLLEVETDKITNVVESPAGGVLLQIVSPQGEVVPVMQVIGIIGESGEAVSAPASQGADAAASPAAPAASGAKSQGSAAQAGTAQGEVRAMPAARKAAKELGVDLATVTGTGRDGIVTEKDVRAAHEAAAKTPAPASAAPAQPCSAPDADADEVIPMDGLRKLIADNMQASLQNSAQLTLVSEADVTACVGIIADLRARHKKDKDFRLSMNDVLILAVSRALKKHPRMNATLDGDTITRHAEVHMGVAVALPEGLVVPVLHNADDMGLLRIASEARLLAGRARKGGLTPDDMSGGTFTITNMAHSVVDFFTPILKPGETGILGLGRVTEKPVVRNGAIVVRSMMGLSLTFDHRVEDGAPAAEFLKTLTEFLAEPALLLF